MKNKLYLLIVLLVLAIGITGFLIYNGLIAGRSQSQAPAEEEIETIGPADPAIVVNLAKSRTKVNEATLTVSSLDGKYVTLEYELSYETAGLRQGASSRPVEISGKDSFERGIYLGTCSRNVCRPHLGVKNASVVLLFTDTSGKKTQFSKDYEL